MINLNWIIFYSVATLASGIILIAIYLFIRKRKWGKMSGVIIFAIISLLVAILGFSLLFKSLRQ